MADDTKTEEEPSIEEILDSIRQIIAEDDDEVSSDEIEEVAPPPDEPLEQSAIDDMDFDTPVAEESEPLDQSAIDDMDFDSQATEPEPEPEPEEDVIELTERAEVEFIEPEVEPEVEPVSKPETEPEPENIDKNLLTKCAEDAAFEAISELARKTAIEHNGITLEDIVRSELKPLLRVWLDKNLPIVIERLVREELERVSKRVLED